MAVGIVRLPHQSVQEVKEVMIRSYFMELLKKDLEGAKSVTVVGPVKMIETARHYWEGEVWS